MMAWPALACECGSVETFKACQIYQSTLVIFRGRVIDHNDNTRPGAISSPILYRFRVIEAYKGIPKGVEEVFIDPSSGGPCQRQYLPDRDYLIFTLGSHPAAGSVFHFPHFTKEHPMLPAWKGLEKSPVYLTGGCNFPDIVSDEDVAYLRSAGKVGPHDNGWVEGLAIQNYFPIFKYADFVGAPKATLAFSSQSGYRASAAADSSGRYRLGPLPPGKYMMSANSPVLGDAKIFGPEKEVPAGGCLVANVSFETLASIAGQVVDVNGKPAPGIRLSLGELLPGGKVPRMLENVYSRGDTTDKQGRFAIERVPIGRIVLAANLHVAPTEQMPFDPYFVPGTYAAEAARVFSVRPGEAVTGVVLKLPKPLPFGSLYVDVVWPDGTPALGGARAFAETNGARADFERASMGSNRVKLRLALDRMYDVRVDWLDSKPREYFWFVEGEDTKTLDFTRDGQVVELRLKSPKP
jgi:hypothetical protein